MDSFALAGCTVHRVEEFVDSHWEAQVFFPELTADAIARNLHWLAPQFWISGPPARIRIWMQTWVLKTPHHTILIDTCNGNHKHRPYFELAHELDTPYLERLAAAGVRPDEVDFVMCTHMHIDHVGWNTRLENGRWVPTFPNAKYLFSRTEYEQFLPENYVGGKPPIFADVFEDSVLPVLQAGLGQLVDGRYELNDLIAMEPAPGHTPGHMIVRAGRAGDVALFVGDALHNPIQIAEPQISTAFCTDPRLAAESRLRILEDCAEHNHLLVPTHFDPPHIGRIRRHPGGAFGLLPGR
jgi:glyoxylase-like metal-dependent hydrolase (beta-lactamase superfamily II)